MESLQWENTNYLFCQKVSYLVGLHRKLRSVGQGMEHDVVVFVVFLISRSVA
jgi:hypothetical protein